MLSFTLANKLGSEYAASMGVSIAISTAAVSVLPNIWIKSTTPAVSRMAALFCWMYQPH